MVAVAPVLFGLLLFGIGAGGGFSGGVVVGVVFEQGGFGVAADGASVAPLGAALAVDRYAVGGGKCAALGFEGGALSVDVGDGFDGGKVQAFGGDGVVDADGLAQLLQVDHRPERARFDGAQLVGLFCCRGGGEAESVNNAVDFHTYGREQTKFYLAAFRALALAMAAITLAIISAEEWTRPAATSVLSPPITASNSAWYCRCERIWGITSS